MNEENLQTLGFMDMHEDQLQAFLQLVQAVLNLAASADDPEVFEEAHAIAEDAVILFGGHGIEIEYRIDH